MEPPEQIAVSGGNFENGRLLTVTSTSAEVMHPDKSVTYTVYIVVKLGYIIQPKFIPNIIIRRVQCPIFPL